MNKIKWMFIVAFMFGIVSFNCTSVRAEETGVGTEIDTSVFEYRENEDGTIYISDYNGTEETVIIPSEIDGMKVKRIEKFSGCNTIKHIIIQEGIVEIGDNAFALCKNLEEVIIPEGLTNIEYYAFSGCESLTHITIPDSVKTIRMGAFSYCTKLSNIKLPNGLKILEAEMFFKCKSLQTIKIPDSVIRIENDVFGCCSNLTCIEIPNKVKNVWDRAFVGCESLNKIVVRNNELTFSFDTFISCIELDEEIVLLDKILDKIVIYANPRSYARIYANKNGIKFSCLNEHDWNNGIITINPTLINKGQKTLTCTACNLKKTEEIPKLELPEKGGSVTDSKSKTTYKVTYPAIQNGTVEFTTSDITPKSVVIPEFITIDGAVYKVTSVSKNAFKNNKKIKKITVGKNIKSIGSNAFSGCKNLKTIIVKSKQIKTIGKNAFKGIHSKAEIKVPKKKLKSYRKMFSPKGLKDSVKIIK